MIDTKEVMRWFPATEYYTGHAQRLSYSFANLPQLPDGFSCLCVGSWGAEVPYLCGAMGASKVVCIRAPDEGVPPVEERMIDAPNGLGKFPTTLYALDIEKDMLPDEVKDFDAVLSWEILEHLNTDPPKMIWQGIRALKIGGVISITTPNALWHYLTTAQLYGDNALGLRLQPHRPFATHWRLYSPAEVVEMCEKMGCQATFVTSFLKTEPFSLKSRFFLALLERFRRNSGNGECSYGQHVYMLATKKRETDLYHPTWLFPETKDKGRIAHLASDGGG